ncbi:MAG: hypothetical protein ABR499_07080 [Gemmatimonadaceae bacterium]
MPKSNTAIILAQGDGAIELSPLDAARINADAMLRAALECCHQHDRYARLVAQPALDAEHRAADEMCIVVTNALAQMAASYCEAAKDLRPNGGVDEDWWHRANALWHASREYGRRQTCCERSSRRTSKRNPEALADLVLQYDLEASALLALRQAAEAYWKVRPEAA